MLLLHKSFTYRKDQTVTSSLETYIIIKASWVKCKISLKIKHRFIKFFRHNVTCGFQESYKAFSFAN